MTNPCQAIQIIIYDNQIQKTDVIEQDTVIDTEASRVSDNRPDQGVLRMHEEESVTADEQARRRLSSKQPARRSLTDGEAMSKRLKREATISAIKEEILKTVPERKPDLEHAPNFYANIMTTKSQESIKASRTVEIKKWRERGVVEKWSREKGHVCKRTHD